MIVGPFAEYRKTATLSFVNDYVPTGTAARSLGVSTATLTRWVARGYVTPAETTAGGHYRWDLDQLRAQVERVRLAARRDPGQTLAEEIASVIHDANRRLQIVQGDPQPSPLWDDAPDYQARENIASVEEALADPERTAEQNHQGWCDRLTADGWTYGPVKDERAKTHPCLVPFGELPAEQQQKDRLFIAIVRALSAG
jgi:DNA-binding transcriptional MerR regulator